MANIMALHGGAALSQTVPASSRSRVWKRKTLSESLANPLDRVDVLKGHTGCVNALSWARDGELLLSGGDDTTVRMWRVDPCDSEKAYPLVCQSVVLTGHRANIFNAQMLPFSSRIVTVAGDEEVRVFDVGEATTSGFDSKDNGTETQYNSREHCTRILKCHTDRVKRIVSEESPDLFLTIAEDGTVRQHDLRTPHNCPSGECPAPIVKLPIELMSLSLSPVTPYQFVVGGESPYGYLFDRRHVGRYLQEEWGLSPDINQATTCVRRFGRPISVEERKKSFHITGTRISGANGHEVLLSYSGDAVYLFSTSDNPGDEESPMKQSSLLVSNEETKSEEDLSESASAKHDTRSTDNNTEDDEDEAMSETGHGSESTQDTNRYVERLHSAAAIVFPRCRFPGACNVRTIKDVNFLGPDDEWVVSGSDDGNWFIWQKSTGELRDILEGDGAVVNVIEGHPHLPLVAVSGMDHTVKLFAPTNSLSSFSRISSADAIVKRNVEASRRRITQHVDIARLLVNYGFALSAFVGSTEADELEPQCRHQ